MKKTKATKLDEVRLASRRYSDSSIMMHEAIARKAGLTGTDHKYLGLLMDKGKLTAGELSELTGLTTGAVTGLIDRLEQKKLAKRSFDKDDRRKIIITPNTVNVTKLLEPVFSELQEKTLHLLSGMSEAQLATVEAYFKSAVTIMNEVTANLNK